MDNKTKREIKPKTTVTTKRVKVAKTRRNGTTFAIVTLSLLLLVSIGLGITAAFFSANANANGNITLGDPVDVQITQGGSGVESLTFDGTALPGTIYTQKIGVKAPASTSTAVVRAKLTLTNTGSAQANVEATTNENWVKGEDDYYYYNGVINAEDTVDFVETITIPTSLTNADANKTYTIAVVVEALQHANGPAKTVWETAPQEWITNYGSGSLPE